MCMGLASRQKGVGLTTRVSRSVRTEQHILLRIAPAKVSSNLHVDYRNGSSNLNLPFNRIPSHGSRMFVTQSDFVSPIMVQFHQSDLVSPILSVARQPVQSDRSCPSTIFRFRSRQSDLSRAPAHVESVRSCTVSDTPLRLLSHYLV